MRKILISLMLAGLLAMATVVPAFAHGPGSPSHGKGNAACAVGHGASNGVAGAAGGANITC